MIVLTAWVGRLGNHATQLGNIIDIALRDKHNISFRGKAANNPFFDLQVIQSYFSKYDNDDVINSTGEGMHFLLKGKLGKIYPKEISQEHIEERIAILRSAWKYTNLDAVVKLHDNDLVIHIRSGDIFHHPHPGYVPPALAYYTNIIDKREYRKIIIVCEDRVNPVVNKLLSLYKNAVHTKNTLKKDIDILLGAVNVVQSVGSFVPALMMISKNIKCLSSWFNRHNPELQDYYEVMSPWKNTKKQREYILSYTYSPSDTNK